MARILETLLESVTIHNIRSEAAIDKYWRRRLGTDSDNVNVYVNLVVLDVKSMALLSTLNDVSSEARKRLKNDTFIAAHSPFSFVDESTTTEPLWVASAVETAGLQDDDTFLVLEQKAGLPKHLAGNI
jgi:hypothetical protein